MFLCAVVKDSNGNIMPMASFTVKGLPIDSGVVPAQADGTMKLDINSIPSDNYLVYVTATDSWGDVSPEGSISFSRPQAEIPAPAVELGS